MVRSYLSPTPVGVGVGTSLIWAVVDQTLPSGESLVVSFPDPPPKKKGGSGEYSAASHLGLAVAMDSAKSSAFKVAFWASVNWRVC